MNRWKEIRLDSKLTVQEVADALHISKQMVSAWENGTKDVPVERYDKLNDIFNNHQLYRKYKIELSYEEYQMILQFRNNREPRG